MALTDLELDPFSKCFAAVWAMAAESKRVCSLVRPSNQIRYDLQSDESPDKPEISEDDLPELSLVPTTLQGGIRQNSSSSKALLRLEWWFATGQPGVANMILPLTFAVYCAMTPWPERQETGTRPLEWRGQKYIKRIDLVDANFGLQRPEQNRGIPGWGCVWACEVEMWYKTTDVIAANDLVIQ
jgi:hypothetical protein